ncbi:MAG: hypothetical protein DHS20C18_25840 [Saprospiraceae bacterium]|nr:MAG: hypothetical protein DHS20C18_25840 [Saprospiraceae bacterium]
MDSGDIFDEITAVLSTMPGDSGNEYTDPSPAQLMTWEAVLNHLLDGDYADAAADAALIDYDLIEYSDIPSGKTYYLLLNNNTNYWGTYVYNPDYCRTLVLQSPHPLKDFNTGKQGIHAFREADALFFSMAGTHRCNHEDDMLSCSGTTKVCDGEDFEKYKISDLAHRTGTLFQQATQILSARYSNTYFVSLHGFTKNMDDPYVILSNGTRVTPNPDFITLLADNLAVEDNLLTFEIPHQNLNWDRLNGFTNTQGRLINASENVCTTNAVTTAGRFIHMEQEKTRLRDDESGWDKVASALINTFSCALLPIELIAFEAKFVDEGMVRCTWTTASEVENDYFEVQRSQHVIDWEKVAIIKGAGNTSNTLNYTLIDSLPYLNTSYYRLKQVDYNGNYTYSPIKAVQMASASKKVSIYPNPLLNQLTIEGNKQDLQGIRIFNILGQELTASLQLETTNPQSLTFNVSNLNSGVYLLKTATFVGVVLKK